MSAMTIQIKRVYEQPQESDGFRALVDGIWPRGVSKDAAAVDDWWKHLAPTTALRKWYGKDIEKWAEFRRRYEKELASVTDALDAALETARAAGKGDVLTLVYSKNDTQHNQAVVLRDVLASRVGR